MDTISVPQSMWEIAGRLGLATLLGAVIGINREWQRKPAGLRTHALVALGGALFTLVGVLLTPDDPSATGRIVQGITAGIGFVGAGVILRRPDIQDVQGLTTAAAIWLVSAIGVAVGAGLWRTSVLALALGMFVLIAGEAIDRWLHRERRWLNGEAGNRLRRARVRACAVLLRVSEPHATRSSGVLFGALCRLTRSRVGKYRTSGAEGGEAPDMMAGLRRSAAARLLRLPHAEEVVRR